MANRPNFMKGPGIPSLKKLTVKEQNYVLMNKSRPIEELAAELKPPRNVSVIKHFLASITVTPLKVDSPEGKPSSSLRSKPEWLQLSQQFSEVELKFFEDKYNELLMQFDNDVTATEEMQIIHLIKLELLTNRILIDVNKLNKDQARLRRAIKDAKDREYETEDNRVVVVSRLEESLSSVLSISHGKNQEYVKLDAEYGRQMREIKGTREQRFKQISERKENWMSLMRSIQDREFAEQEGTMLAKVQAAVEKERERLSSYHQYGDGQVDQPLLTADSIKEDYEQ